MSWRVFIFVVCSLALVGQPAYAEKETVTIGVVLPLTGGLVTFGLDARKTLEVLEPQLAASPTKYAYRFIMEDGQCGQGSAAITAAQKLIHADHARFLVVGCSGELMQIAPLAEKTHIVTIAYAASHPDVRNLGDYIFRTYVDISKGVALMADRISREVHNGSIALLTEENAFTAGIKDLLEARLASRIGFSDDFRVDENDFKTLLLKARAAKVRAYYLNCASPRTYRILLSQLRQSGINEPVYTYHMPSDPDAIKTLGAGQNGVKYIDVPDIDQNIASEDFRRLYTSFIAKNPDGPNMDFLMRTSFDAFSTLVSAIEEVGPEPELVKELLYKKTFSGATGEIRFDTAGDIKNLNWVIKEIVDGVPKTLP